MSQQLVKKGANGKHVNVMPRSWIEAIKDKNTGQTLVEILQGFNMYFLPYNGNTSSTRCLVPTMLRKKGLWITYVKYDGNVYTEWYAADEIDDKSWGDSSNWRIGNNTLVGDITISANGNWVINGIETEFKAVGEKGNTPLIRVANNRLQVSYDLGDTYMNVTENPVYTKFRWLATSRDTKANNVGRIQASTDEGKTWSNMSNDFINNLHISRYIGVSESLPTSGIAEGTIYAKGPYYAEDDTLNDNPIYRLWVYAWKGNTLAWQDNGEFTSIAAGVVQETGDSENAVMSQKAVTDKFYELESKERSITEDVDLAICDNKGNSIVDFVDGHIKTKNFSSKKTTQIEINSNADFSICDEKGNSIVDFENGHIKTKNFSSDGGQNGKSSNFPFGIKSSLYFYRSTRLMRPNAQPLIIVIGQSNADGRANYTSAPAWLKENNYQVPRYKVWDAINNDFKDYNVFGMTGNGGNVPGSDGSGTNKFAFDAFFAHQYLADNPNKTLYMVRTTLGDTGLYDQPTQGSRNWTWSPDTDNIVEGCNSLLLSLQEKVYNALNFAKDSNIELMPIAILWHQGEKDASSEASIKAYKTNLSNLISWVRGLFNMPHLAFINAYINGEYSESYARINPIFNEINKEDFYTKTVNMEGHYNMLPDNIHFNAQGLEYMGNQMYELFKQLV